MRWTVIQNNPRNIELECDEKVVEDNPIDQNPLVDYKLAIDREGNPHREPQRIISIP